MWWLVLLGCGFLEARLDVPLDPEATEGVRFEVPQGASAQSLGPRLASEGLVKNDATWQAYLRLSEGGSCLKAGRFELVASLAPSEILAVLCGVPIAEDMPFTVVEGWRISEIDAALVEAGLAAPGVYAEAAHDPDRFDLQGDVSNLVSLEGFLYPDTYRVEPDSFTVDAFIERQLATFEARFVTPNPHGIATRGLYPLVIMASMIEREEPTDSQRSLVSGILWKRLDSSWKLGVDATSRYTLDQWNDRSAFLAKLRDPSDPYNTRLRHGLPPTPIGNPGTTALEAALHPVDSRYWYYLHDSDGTLHPAVDGAGHAANRRTYNVY